MDGFDYLNKTLIFIVFFSIIVVFIFMLRDKANNSAIKDIYNLAINEYIDDPKAASISSYCRNDSDEVACVINYIDIKYNDTNSSKIKSPSELVTSGGNCKDIAVFYGIIFKRLNYTITFRFPVPAHTSISISKQLEESVWRYCDLELNKMQCYEVQL